MFNCFQGVDLCGASTTIAAAIRKMHQADVLDQMKLRDCTEIITKALAKTSDHEVHMDAVRKYLVKDYKTRRGVISKKRKASND